MSEDEIDINYYRDKLTDLRQELLKENQTSNEATKTVELDQSKVGRLSRMDAMQSQAMAVETKRRREIKAVETKRRREIKMHRVESAIKRIEQDEFGYCTHCGLEINPKRLEFDPTALLCIDCARSGEN
jgi:DnaK suppressor protein